MRQPAARSFFTRLVYTFLACTWFSSFAALAADCDTGKVPDDGVTNTWFCYTDSDTAVVFVHGLHSSSRTAWLGETSKTYWPTIAATDPSLKNAAVFLAGFYTASDSTTFGMKQATGSLFTALSSPAGGHPPVIAKKNILFVAHSLGGILTRDLLTRNRAQFAGKRVGLLLVASPSSGADAMKWLAGTANTVAMSDMVGELASGSRYLDELDRDFKSLIRDRTVALDGREIFEQYFVDLAGGKTWLPDIVRKRLAPLVPMDKTVKYFIDPQLVPGSDHVSIAKPETRESLAHQKLLEVYGLMLQAPEPSCEAPADFEIALDIKTGDDNRGLNPQWPDAVKAVLPQYKFIRHYDFGDVVIKRPVPRDSETGRYFFRPLGAFPCKGEKFSATFRRVPAESTMSNADVSTGLCFTRSLTKPNEKNAGFGCAEGQACALNTSEAGLAESCPSARQGWLFPRFVSPAHAATEPAASDAVSHWSVPSLDALTEMPDAIRTGYAEFTVTSQGRVELANANAYSVGYKVNGVTLYVDGLPPHSEQMPYDPARGLQHTFALENLGFTGGDTGYETIEIEIKYWQGHQVVASDAISRGDYISYRHAPRIDVKASPGGMVYMWGGLYRPAKVQTSFEVMLATDPKPAGMLKTRSEFNKIAKSYSGAPVVAVMRPGRKDNKTNGMTFGIRLPTGQVKSLFSEAEAKAICTWVKSDPRVPAWMKKAAYLYSFPADAFSTDKDRGKYAGACGKG